MALELLADLALDPRYAARKYSFDDDPESDDGDFELPGDDDWASSDEEFELPEDDWNDGLDDDDDDDGDDVDD